MKFFILVESDYEHKKRMANSLRGYTMKDTNNSTTLKDNLNTNVYDYEYKKSNKTSETLNSPKKDIEDT